jgi:hypothetical protein
MQNFGTGRFMMILFYNHCTGLNAEFISKEECQRLGMGAYLAVQQGSKFNPQFVHLHYKRADASLGNPLKIALIGKGLTFDRYYIPPLMMVFVCGLFFDQAYFSQKRWI